MATPAHLRVAALSAQLLVPRGSLPMMRQESSSTMTLIRRAISFSPKVFGRVSEDYNNCYSSRRHEPGAVSLQEGPFSVTLSSRGDWRSVTHRP